MSRISCLSAIWGVTSAGVNHHAISVGCGSPGVTPGTEFSVVRGRVSGLPVSVRV